MIFPSFHHHYNHRIYIALPQSLNYSTFRYSVLFSVLPVSYWIGLNVWEIAYTKNPFQINWKDSRVSAYMYIDIHRYQALQHMVIRNFHIYIYIDVYVRICLSTMYICSHSPRHWVVVRICFISCLYPLSTKQNQKCEIVICSLNHCSSYIAIFVIHTNL